MTLQAIDTLNHNGGGHDTAVVAGAKGKTDQAIDATLSKKKEARRTSKVFKRTISVRQRIELRGIVLATSVPRQQAFRCQTLQGFRRQSTPLTSGRHKHLC